MLDSLMANNAAPQRPTLVLDNGSRFTAVMLALPGMEASRWPKAELPAERPVEQALDFLKKNNLPFPELTLLCGMNADKSDSPAQKRRAERIQRWKDALRRTEGRPDLLMKSDFSDWEVAPLLSDARRLFGTAVGVDSGLAALLAALSLESVRDRSFCEGVTILWAGHRHVQAFMVYQERLLGLYEQHSDISRDALMNDLKEMRLNWLPDEQVRASGGHGCICGDLPAEAEGFRPTYIMGPGRDNLKDCGRLISPCGDDRFDRCFGLIFGLSLGETA